MTKGVATAANVVLVTIILLTFFGYYMYMASNEVDNTIKLNLESLQALKMKSVFYTFNQSLGTTWLISTIQAAFHAGEEGLGCGDDAVTIEQRLWLQDRGVSRKNFTSADLANLNDKYNGMSTPSICFPREDDIRNYFLSELEEYTTIPEIIEADDVTIERKNLNYDVQISDTGVTSVFSQQLNMRYGDGNKLSLSSKTQNTNTVNTLLKKMAESGRNAVASLLLLGDSHSDFTNELAFFRPFGLSASGSGYLESIRSRVNAGITTSNLHPDVNVDVDIKELRFYADDGSKFTQAGGGLVVRYNATLRYSEMQDRYYYYNESSGTFSKRPVALEFDVQDSLPAMSCLYWSNFAVTNFGRNAPFFFNYIGENDVMCCNGHVFSCGVHIDQLSAEQSLSPGQSTSDNIPQQKFCNLILAGQSIQCTNSGFDTSP